MLASLSKHISAEETRPYIEKGLEGSNVNEQSENNVRKGLWTTCQSFESSFQLQESISCHKYLMNTYMKRTHCAGTMNCRK